MRIVAGQFRELHEEDLAFARQIGATGVMLNKPNLEGPFWTSVLGRQRPGTTEAPAPMVRWEALDLINIHSYVKQAGLALEAIEGVPRNFLNKVVLGLPGRDEQIENFQHTLRSMGAAGIPVLGYNWIPDVVWRTSRSAPGRGGAQVTEYDDTLGQRVATHTLPPRSEEEMWVNYEYFIRAVLPVAEEAGVQLALHPDDPPVPMLDGVARIMRSPAAFRRALTIGDSPNHGLTLCLGTCAEMGGDAVFDSIRGFGPQGKITYVHLRNVKGSLPHFSEAFVDEPGFDPVAALKLLQDVGFDGFVIDDHVPHMVNDTDWGHRSRAFNTGVIRGICLALEAGL